VLLLQSVQRGLLVAVVSVMDRGAIWRPARAAGRLVARWVPGRVSPHGVKPCALSQSPRSRLAVVCPPPLDLQWVTVGVSDRQLQGGDMADSQCLFGVDTGRTPTTRRTQGPQVVADPSDVRHDRA
jgi:hypothetical protein